ncbi:MAG: 4-hydroxy-tetrahydrodipicolinate synthase [Flavobacteriales bacterium]|nr:4-hydroxy-tetrahydrodipicolinate synthase [Flavobacteriales bacterium]
MSNILGTGVALITPFNNNSSIDFKSLANLIEHVINGGVDFLVILGTTAETTSLSVEEKKEVINFIIEKNKRRLPLVLGIGGNNTDKVIKEILSTDLSSFAAILSVTPYYNKPSQEGLYSHYKEISQASPIPIILYNVPSRTGVNMSANITLRLANNFSNIIAIKEASGDLKQINQILDEKPASFNVLSGDDALTLEMINSGASGVISVIGQSHPQEFSDMVSAGLDNDKLKANKIHNDLFGLYHFLYSEGNPSGIKALLSLMDLCENNLRLPLVPISNSLHNEFKQYINGLH